MQRDGENESSPCDYSSHGLDLNSGSDGRRIFARRKGYRARPADLIKVASCHIVLAEPKAIYQIKPVRLPQSMSLTDYRLLKVRSGFIVYAATLAAKSESEFPASECVVSQLQVGCLH